jgi:hypothetical protein
MPYDFFSACAACRASYQPSRIIVNMSHPEISGPVIHEFEKIVRSHTEAHQKEKWFKIACLIVFGVMPYLEIDRFPFVASLTLLALMIWGVKVWLAKPDFSKDISPEEIKELSDNARSVFRRLVRTSNRGVLLSDLASMVRTASQENRASMKIRQQAESNRRAREQQERALDASRET